MRKLILVLAIGGLCVGHAAAQEPASQHRASPSTRQADALTGKAERSPVLGPKTERGWMGGTFPGLVPGPPPGDIAYDDQAPNVGYTFVPGEGWQPTDEVSARLHAGNGDHHQ